MPVGDGLDRVCQFKPAHGASLFRGALSEPGSVGVPDRALLCQLQRPRGGSMSLSVLALFSSNHAEQQSV